MWFVILLLFVIWMDFYMQHTFSSNAVMKHVYPSGYAVTLSKYAYGNNGYHLSVALPEEFAMNLTKLN